MKLPRKTKTRIYNYSLIGMSPDEIAKTLGVGVTTARRYMAVSAKSKRGNFKP